MEKRAILQTKFSQLVSDFVLLDKEQNIVAIELQVCTPAYAEVNVVFDNYDAIPDEIWEYATSSSADDIQIELYGADEVRPQAECVLYSRG